MNCLDIYEALWKKGIMKVLVFAISKNEMPVAQTVIMGGNPGLRWS